MSLVVSPGHNAAAQKLDNVWSINTPANTRNKIFCFLQESFLTVSLLLCSWRSPRTGMCTRHLQDGRLLICPPMASTLPVCPVPGLNRLRPQSLRAQELPCHVLHLHYKLRGDEDTMLLQDFPTLAHASIVQGLKRHFPLPCPSPAHL